MKLTENGILKFRDISEVGITEGLVAWYPLNGDALDKSSYGNDGVINGATVAQGLGQLCYELNGIDANYIRIEDNLIFKSDSISVSTWFNTNKGQAYILSKSNGNTINRDWTISISPAKILSFRIYGNEDASMSKSYSTINPIETNRWYFICFTWESESMKCYINGINEGFEEVGNDIFTIRKTGTAPFLIGIEMWNNNWGSYRFGGLIQDVRIYNRALTPEEVKILYDTTGVNTPMKIDENGKIYIKNLKEV